MESNDYPVFPVKWAFCLGLFGLSLLTFSCGDDEPGISCGPEPVSYASEVAPVISTRCATSGCHNSGSTNGPGALTNYSQVFNARNSIRSSVNNGSMPPGGLSQSGKQAIICWIDSGAPNN